MTDLTVHHLEDSRSQRVLWLLEELGLDYRVEHYRRGDDMRAPDSLRRVHPLGKSPVITDGDTTLAETGAIVEYILAMKPDHGLMPQEGTDAYWRARHFMHYAEGSAMPPILVGLILGTIPERAPFMMKPILSTAMDQVQSSFLMPEINRHIAHWESALGEIGWFAGSDLSAADIMMSFPVETANERFDLRDHPKLRAFLDRIHGRDAYRRALERGGAYRFA